MTQAFPFTYVLNVIAAHKEAAEEAAQLRAVLAQTGGVAEIEWLSPFHAFDIPFESNPHAALNEARALAERLPLDVNVLPAEGRRKKLLVADMDSTIINCECLDELADMAGIKAKVSAITERAMRGELDFAAALRERVAMLKGLSLSALHRVYADRIRLNPGAKTLVATMRKHGAHTLLVSGGFSYFTSRVARDGGFHSEQANDLLDDGTTLTGLVREPILGREAKLAALEKSAADLKIGVADALAVGDGANDLAMIQRAGMGVAYHAKPIVAAAAGANITHGDLTALLYLQGYCDDEIVRAG
ncbi:MAG: phosphoserine phosphatase SerB [Rhizomicrobium sp.]